MTAKPVFASLDTMLMCQSDNVIGLAPKTHFGRPFDEVERGEMIVITRRGWAIGGFAPETGRESVMDGSRVLRSNAMTVSYSRMASSFRCYRLPIARHAVHANRVLPWPTSGRGLTWGPKSGRKVSRARWAAFAKSSISTWTRSTRRWNSAIIPSCAASRSRSEDRRASPAPH